MSTRICVAIALLLATPLWTTPAPAQKATEQYIPVGRSPGLSGYATLVGRIEAVDAKLRILTVSGREVVVADATSIWLDRTSLGLTNTRGALADCRRGLTVEVKLADDGRAADWIKVAMPGS